MRLQLPRAFTTRVLRSLAYVWIAISLVTLAAYAADSQNESSTVQAKVAAFIQELDAPQAARRNAAEMALLKLGNEALPFIPTNDDSLSPEAALRLKRIRARLAAESGSEKRELKDADVDLGGASTLGAALEAISRDSGIEFEHALDVQLAIEPFDGKLPFWHALDYVLDQVDLDIDFYASDGSTLHFTPRNPNRPRRVDAAAYSGIYRLEPMIVTSRRVLTDVTLSGLNVELEISWRPDSHPIGVSIPLNQLRATLDDGATIDAQQTDGTIDIAPTKDLSMTTVQLALDLPAGRPSKILSLTGQIKSMLPGEKKAFRFPLKLGQREESFESVTVRLEEIRKNGPLHEVRLGVEYKSPGRAMESHRGWLLGNNLWVETPDGARQDHLGYELYRHNETGIGIGYLFDIGDAVGDATLVYETPTSVVEQDVAFVLSDIPMP